jgi:hypothetical protein
MDKMNFNIELTVIVKKEPFEKYKYIAYFAGMERFAHSEGYSRDDAIENLIYNFKSMVKQKTEECLNDKNIKICGKHTFKFNSKYVFLDKENPHVYPRSVV